MVFTELLEQAEGVGFFQALQVLTFFLLSVWAPIQLVVNFSAAVPGRRCCAHTLDNGSEAPANLTPEALLAVPIPLSPNQEPHHCLRFRQPQWQLLDPNATATNWSEAATEPCVDGWVYDRSTFTSTIVTERDLVCDYQGLKPLGQCIYLAGAMAGITWGLLSHRFGRKPVLSWRCLQVAWPASAPSLPPISLSTIFERFGIVWHHPDLVVERTTTCTRAVTMTILRCTCSIGQTAMGSLAFALWDRRALQLALLVPLLVTFLMSCRQVCCPPPPPHMTWGECPIYTKKTKTQPSTCFFNRWPPESARWLIMVGKTDRALQELKKVAKINGHKEAKKTRTIEVLMSSMEEDVASAKSRRSGLGLFRMRTLRWRSCRLLVVSLPLTLSYDGLVLSLQNLGSNIFLLQVLFGAAGFRARITTTLLLRFFGRHTTLAGSLAVAGHAILANMLVPQDLQTLHVILAVLGKGCFGISLTCIMVYKPELFPTSLRMTAEGFLHSAGQRGSVMGPLTRMTREVLPLLAPPYGVIPIVSNLIVLFLLETWGLPLPDTIQDLERQ
ncbi:LOW QUALITY PROTEIN: solute carrier family 22 member 11 [Megaptera novaeangliae]